MNDNLIEMKGIRKIHKMGFTNVTALDGIDLDVGRGEFIVLSGPSGSGKTSLLNIIGCLDAPDSGTYTLSGNLVTATDFDTLAPLRSEYMGFVFQEFNLIPVLNVYENVAFPLVKRNIARDNIQSLIEKVGLGGHMRHKPDELSGGQRQRVAIARALVTRPVMVLADEPTANLDSVNARAIMNLMLELNTAMDVTFIFSSHDSRVMEHAKRIVTLEDGRIVNDSGRSA